MRKNLVVMVICFVMVLALALTGCAAKPVAEAPAAAEEKPAAEAADSEAPAEAPAELTAAGGALEQLTKAMSSKPKRALIVEGQPVDPELLGQAEELIDTSPEAGAAILKQWLRGGM
jgi:flagellar biosynthesis/type III secretory pathway M-ring protein FliF/YscJ